MNIDIKLHEHFLSSCSSQIIEITNLIEMGGIEELCFDTCNKSVIAF